MNQRHRWYRLESATTEVFPPGKYIVRDEEEPRIDAELELFDTVPLSVFRDAPRRVPSLTEVAHRLADPDGDHEPPEDVA